MKSVWANNYEVKTSLGNFDKFCLLSKTATYYFQKMGKNILLDKRWFLVINVVNIFLPKVCHLRI